MGGWASETNRIIGQGRALACAIEALGLIVPLGLEEQGSYRECVHTVGATKARQR